MLANVCWKTMSEAQLNAPNNANQHLLGARLHLIRNHFKQLLKAGFKNLSTLLRADLMLDEMFAGPKSDTSPNRFIPIIEKKKWKWSVS